MSFSQEVEDTHTKNVLILTKLIRICRLYKGRQMK